MVSPRRVAVALPLFAREHAAGWRTPLRRVDLLLLAYLAIVSAVALTRLRSQPGCWWLFLAHALFVLLLFLMTRPGLGRVGRAIRELYPIILLPGLYGELDVLSSPARPVHDVAVQHWEQLIFGMQVSREWWQRVPERLLVHGVSHCIPLLLSDRRCTSSLSGLEGEFERGTAFRLRRHDHLRDLLSVLHFFSGRRSLLRVPPSRRVVHSPTPRLAGHMARCPQGSSYGAAFPSSHVAAALTATLAAKRASRLLGLILRYLRSCSRWEWFTARCITASMPLPGWWWAEELPACWNGTKPPERDKNTLEPFITTVKRKGARLTEHPAYRCRCCNSLLRFAALATALAHQLTTVRSTFRASQGPDVGDSRTYTRLWGHRQS